MLQKENSVVSIREYGRIRSTLKSVLEKRNMTRNELARLVGTRFEVIDKWYRDDVKKIDADILAKICYVLHCGVADILEYDAPNG